jgi:hypothetical protein
VHDVTPILWAVDSDYPFKHLLDEHVAWFDGHFRPPHFGDTFLQRAAAWKPPSCPGSIRASLMFGRA